MELLQSGCSNTSYEHTSCLLVVAVHFAYMKIGLGTSQLLRPTHRYLISTG